MATALVDFLEHKYPSEATPWDDECWGLVATAEVEDAGDFYKCAIYEHKVGGGHCIYLGEDEYEGMGAGQTCGTYSFKNGVLRDSDGDIIPVNNVVETAANTATAAPDPAAPDPTATDSAATDSADAVTDNTATAAPDPAVTHSADAVTDNTATAAPDTAATDKPDETPNVGDCLEVFWDEEWYPCVVKQTRADPADGSPIWLCHYDKEDRGIWHNLLLEQTRRVTPTPERIARLTSGAIRSRLRSEGVRAKTSMRKTQLISLLISTLTSDIIENDHNPFDSHDHTPADSNTPAESNNERAKYGATHAQRVSQRKRKQADLAMIRKQKSNKRKRPRTGAQEKRTCTQVVDGIGEYAKALYTLSTRGSRRDDRQHEREGYNLLVFSQHEMSKWDEHAHVWKGGEMDMSLLPRKISCCYDTTGWKCVNTYLNGDGVVFLRPPPPMKVRGCGALCRRKNFKWSSEMNRWLHQRTCNTNMKSTPFVALALEAESKWGYSAPQQEHIENRIRGREKAKKDNRPPPRWVASVTM